MGVTEIALKKIKRGILALIHGYYGIQSLLSVLTEGDHKQFAAILNMPRKVQDSFFNCRCINLKLLQTWEEKTHF